MAATISFFDMFFSQGPFRAPFLRVPSVPRSLRKGWAWREWAEIKRATRFGWLRFFDLFCFALPITCDRARSPGSLGEPDCWLALLHGFRFSRQAFVSRR